MAGVTYYAGASARPEGTDRQRHGLRAPLLAALVAAAMAIPAIIGLLERNEGVERGTTDIAGIPVTTMKPASGPTTGALVLAHGFSGSATIMETLGAALARAGYAVAMPDFDGHGANPEALALNPDGTIDTAALQANLDAVVTEWRTQHPDLKVGLVGHSMGAGAVVRYAVDHPEISATASISLPSADAIPAGNPASPRNLLLLWGSAEPAAFTEAGEKALRAAYPTGEIGSSYGAQDVGTARGTEVIQGSEHIGIVFRPATAQAIIDWMDSSVAAPSPGHLADVDRRLPSAALLLLALTIGTAPLARLLFGGSRRGPSASARVIPMRWAAPLGLLAIAAGVAATWAFPTAGAWIPLAVGGWVWLWFLTTGAASVGLSMLPVSRPPSLEDAQQGDAKRATLRRPILATLALTSVTITVLALSAQASWAPFAFVGDRMWMVPVLEIAFIAYFWGEERLISRESAGRRLALAVALRLAAVVAILASVQLLGAPTFLSLLLPLMVLFFAVLLVQAQIVYRLTTERWAPAVVQAIPMAYLVASAFPLVANAH